MYFMSKRFCFKSIILIYANGKIKTDSLKNLNTHLMFYLNDFKCKKEKNFL